MSHTCVSGKKNNYDDYYAHADGANFDDHDDNEDDNWKVKGLLTVGCFSKTLFQKKN